MMSGKALFLSLILSVVFCACRKGEDDPLISLRSRAARVEGKWKMAEGFKMNEVFGFTKTVYTRTTYEKTWNGTAMGTGTVNYTIDFQENGTVVIQRMLESGDESGFKGTWNFTGGIGKTKNKEQIVIHDATQTNADMVFNIKELRNKKLVLRRTAEFSNGTKYYEEEFEFQQ